MEYIYGMIDMLGVIICFFCCVSVLQEKTSDNQKNLLMAYACGFLSSIANALEFYARSEEMAITAVKIGYVGKAFICHKEGVERHYIFCIQYMRGAVDDAIWFFSIRYACGKPGDTVYGSASGWIEYYALELCFG